MVAKNLFYLRPSADRDYPAELCFTCKCNESEQECYRVNAISREQLVNMIVTAGQLLREHDAFKRMAETKETD